MNYTFKPVEDLVFSDDFMFGAVMREPKICKGVLERLLKTKISKIEYPELQKSISPFYSQKGVRLDVYLSDSDRIFDVECQTYKIADIGSRMRYYQSMIDADTLLKGNGYSELKESYVIFICTNDPFGRNLPVYTFERTCRENAGVELNDKTHHVVFNAAAWEAEEDGELKAFLSFVMNNEAKSAFTREVAEMVQTKKFENTFINEYLAVQLHEHDVERRAKQAGLAEGRAAGLAAGRAEEKRTTARNLLSLNVPVETISAATGLSPSEIESL